MSIAEPAANSHFDIDAAAQRDVPVLISGGCAEERESLARRLHSQSRRAEEAFTRVDCTSADAIGAALAGRLYGVVFLDNIDALNPAQQSLISRLLETSGTCRVVAGTGEDLVPTLRRGVFSSTLFYRLNTVHVTLTSVDRGASGA